MHARINAKIMFFAPKSRPAYAMSLMSPPTDCFAGREIIQAIQKQADNDCPDDMGQDMPEIIHGHEDSRAVPETGSGKPVSDRFSHQ